MELNSKAVMVVLSGGQDSTTCLGWALEHFKRVHAVTFNYGQRHDIELDAARKVVQHFVFATGRVIPHEVVNIADGTLVSSSPLTDPSAQLELYANHAEMEAIIGARVEKTFVPMRNAIFLMLAMNRAVAAGCANLVTGVCEADNANYPDCRASFIHSSESTINHALGTEYQSRTEPDDQDNFVRIHTPLIRMSKAQSIWLAMQLPHTYSALALSHTAYDGKYPPTSKDHASVLRAYGFEQAGVPDPLVVRAWAEGLMDLPDTANYDKMREAGEPSEQLAQIMKVLS